MRYVLLGIVLFFITTVTWGIFNLGVFKSAHFHEIDKVHFNLIYQNHIGPYYEINDKIKTMETWAAQNQVECQKTFGLFYDDPDLVEVARLRSSVGCVTSNIPASLPAGTESMTLTTANVLQADFAGSPWLGPYKVYGPARNYFAEKKVKFSFPVLEIYKSLEKPPSTEYYFFLTNMSELLKASQQP